MYFPYLRGRQYELLALKELATGNLLGKSVIPVIEPVKITSTFGVTINTFIDAQLPVALILNPALGDLVGKPNASAPLYDLLKEQNVIPSMLMGRDAEDMIASLDLKAISTDMVLTLLADSDFIDSYKDIFADNSPKFTLCPEKSQIRRAVTKNKVLFEDKFNKKNRNADYPSNEAFSEDHLFFQEEGFIGFGDYSIIGDNYDEGGFLPWAVAIHIVYFDKDNKLRIGHFISDSINDDYGAIAEKFYEAVTKLTAWYNDGNQWQQTYALSKFLDHHANGSYPGLPTIKKLSIMHHLELMGRFLDGGLCR